jgi:glutamate synthase (NADPH) large chain
MPQITPNESCPTPKATPIDASRIGLPPAQGLYHPNNEHDACGVGFVAHIKGKKSHAIIQQGLKILENLDHRGAVGADKLMGDGAGILIQIPDTLYRDEFAQHGITLPPPGEYGVAMVFLPKETASRLACEQELERSVRAEGQVVLGWRNVPVDVDMPMSPTVRDCEPVIRQLFIGRGADVMVPDALERKLYVIRKTASHAIQNMHLAHGKEYFVPSASVRTVVYKGLLLADQVGRYYRDLADPRTVSALALVHQRFSTNTFPAWPLAHPYRMIAHNGEINTVKGNFNWLRAREGMMQSAVLGDDLKKLYPIVYEGQSDTATFDNCLELLVNSGYSLAHAMMMMIPEAWEQHTQMDESRRAFYEYHAAMMEPWDGPAAVAFTDGRQIGATLDRNGLRPARYLVTDDDMVILASEAGTLSIPENRIVKKWRLQPGKMFLIDLEQGRIIDDAEIKLQLANSRPYRQWIERLQIKLESLPAPRQAAVATQSSVSLLDRQQAFGWTQEDYKFILEPMASTGEEVIGSMGNDAPLAVLSDRAKPFYNYFRQLFAQVTNPPIDPIREQMVMSLVSFIGPKPNLLDINNVNPPLRLEVSQPVLDFAAMAQIRDIEQVTGKKFRSFELDITYPAAWGPEGIEARVAALCARAVDAVQSGYNILIVSDRLVDSERVAIPALLATSAVHQHLIRAGLRTNTGLVVETGSAREVHHFALLGGYGAEAIHPYLALESLGKMSDPEKAVKNFIKAIGKGLNKVMSKMGISTYMSYTGAQIFEAVGLQSSLVNKYFTGTASNIEGIGIFQVAEEALRQHRAAFGSDPVLANDLEAGGEYAYRVRGEEHMWTPDSIAKLQHASRANNYRTYKEYAQIINDQSRRHMTLRGLFEFRFDPSRAIPLDDVEPAKDIVKRFATGAMSLGSISTEAHSVLAVAMNRIGGKSNTGEGGEDELRYRAEMREGRSTIKDGDTLASVLGSDRIEADVALKKGDSLRSKIKQVASGRFGVTAEYLSSADQIQIKMAQCAKPGEGGQLPGHKVSEYIAKLRYSVPGVGLISPPPHHDIYSIEDLAQLIHDLKNVNAKASISVKLVSEVGVGTVAAGVAKAKADHVVIALGTGPGRNPADAGAEPSAQPHPRAGRRPDEDRPRRRHRRAAGRGRIRFRHGAAGCRRLHHDAQVPPEHLPGGRGHAGSGAAQEVPGQARARRQLLLLHCRGSARDHGPAGHPQVRRPDRPRRPAGHALGRRALEGAGPGLHPRVPPDAVRRRSAPDRRTGSRPGRRARSPVDRTQQAGAGARREGLVHRAGAQPQPHHRRHAVGRRGRALRPRRPAGRHHPHPVQRHRRPELRRVPGPWHHHGPGGRRQRLRRQGPVGRPHHRALAQ